ncbi:hypothetical protein, partial [Pseudomonas alvandae]|uniref:hypothetical protein n=1 Tax=Pseudomonas canavaninivorans TaxID=2842348 RepID=UPI002B1E0889
KLKEFSVSTAPEVGRIIDTWNLPSTLYFAFLSISCAALANPSLSLLESLFYIEGRLKGPLLP